MKKVKCAICGVVTSEFIRHNLIPYCYHCFFLRFNFCSKCGKAFPYEVLQKIETKQELEYYCWECYEQLFECHYCHRKIGKSETMFIDEELNLVCEDCHFYLQGGYDVLG